MIDFQDAPIAGFGATHDVFKDGSVVLLPTPGHSPGHLCVLINLDGYRLLVAGDCLYTLRHLANGDVQAFGAGKWMKMQNDSIKKIQRLAEASDNLVVVPVHDHTAYQFEYLEPMLAKGYLTPEDRDKIKIYVSDIFDGGWRLKASHRPAYIPGANKERIGTVKE
jgi:glyoxylase-like metal-dependent hydrolase (beta-lactamase superfamily II)